VRDGPLLALEPSNQPETCYDHQVDTPVGQLMNIVVDCPDADISARFWAAVLGWERVQENADSVDIADASDGRRRLVFQQIADYRPPGWPDQGPPQQLHLDVRVDDLEIADQRVRALGAVPLGERVVLKDETYRVYADPAGHPFCLVQPETT
jgi:catechol 2,3-dioxygenase-like lactoylglutathione lyase family enzyme